MSGYPTSKTRIRAITDEGMPTLRKSETSSHGTPVGPSKEMALMLGKELTGRPMAPEHIRAFHSTIKI
jgi:hypothetical protein